MIPLTWGVVAAIAMSFGFIIRLALDESRARQTFTSFGESSPDHVDAGRVLFLEYAKQQRWAFGLLWFTLAIAVVLTTGLLVHAMTGRAGDVTAIREIAGLAIDACLAGGAARLYRTASQRLEKAVREFAR